MSEEVRVASLTWEEAWLLAGRLRADGIPARVYPEAFSSAYGEALHPAFDVLVPEERAAEARDVIASTGRVTRERAVTG